MNTRNETKKRLAGLVMLWLAALSMSACAPARPRHARVVVIEAGHVHNAQCGHYRHGKRWYFVKGHAHGPRCGHHFVGGVWIVR